MLPIDYLPGARRDFDESFDWYAERSAEAAIGFANAVDAALAAAAKDPMRFPAIDATHRQCAVKKFPFCIVYRFTQDRVVVVALAHAKRRPGYWKARE